MLYIPYKPHKAQGYKGIVALVGCNHSGSSGGWEERTKLREKVTLNLINNSLLIVPTAVTIKLMKLGS